LTRLPDASSNNPVAISSVIAATSGDGGRSSSSAPIDLDPLRLGERSESGIDAADRLAEGRLAIDAARAASTRVAASPVRPTCSPAIGNRKQLLERQRLAVEKHHWSSIDGLQSLVR
jgi:hypothetical protein